MEVTRGVPGVSPGRAEISRCDLRKTRAPKVLRIPAAGCEESERQLNGFIASHRVLTVDRRFVDVGENSYWAICVDFILSHSDGKSGRKDSQRKRVDYREILSATEFNLYARLRDARKQLAADDGVPVYAVFTNEQLAQIVRQNVQTLTALKTIDGVGEARIDKYGSALLAAITTDSGKTDTSEPNNETSG